MQSDKSVNENNNEPRRRDALKAVVSGFAALPLLYATACGERRPSGSGAASAVGDMRDQLFDDGWRFFHGDAEGAERPDFDDGAWRALDLPHDWSVEDLPPRPESTGEAAIWPDSNVPARIGPFDKDQSEGQGRTGWFVGGTGWYRKRFSMAALPAGRQVEIRFDGVYMNADVWLNGNHLGNHPYGYTSFAYDLTPHLRRDGENVLAVRVRNHGRNSRWYSGSGIYRHVWLTATGEVRVPLWGVLVTTPEVSEDAATVKVAVKVANRGKTSRDVTVRVRLLDPAAAQVASQETTRSLAPGAESDVEQAIALTAPKLWTTTAPNLYRAEIDLVNAGETLDQVATPFGIRKIELDAEHGFRLNGEVVKLKGGCMHHANGLLGAATIDRAEQRRVELMKANGFNAIRTSHNPPSPAFLDACDRLGVLVMDEAFDMWQRQKSPQDYHLYFDEWWQRDIDSMVLRDRNHPSVVFWSIGNEIPERADPEGVALSKQLVDRVKQLDPTRPVTAAINGLRGRPWSEADAGFQHLDLAGYNYQWESYESDHARILKRVIAGTESFPMEAFENWQLVEKHPYVIGDFVWTGMDYLGEAALANSRLSAPQRRSFPGAPPAQPAAQAMMQSFMLSRREYPWFNAYCGDIDLIGDKKPQMYYRDVLWGNSKLEMAVQRLVPEGRTEELSRWGWSDELRSWTWPGYEGKNLVVRVYSSGDQVRLLLNGKEIGAKPVSAATRLTAEFEVPYASGELKAIALAGGNEIAQLAFKTAGPPAKLRLNADRQSIRPDRNDLAYVTLDVLDQAGDLVPDATVPVTFTISGAGELAAVGTGNPKDVESFRRPRPKTFLGRCLAIVRPTGSRGSITLRVEAEGLTAATVTIKVG